MEMSSALRQCAWSSVRLNAGASLQRAEHVGLVNLGNTCYFNAFIQSLYMTDEFCYRIFAVQPREGQILRELQRVFGYLLLSQRNSYEPKSNQIFFFFLR